MRSRLSFIISFPTSSLGSTSLHKSVYVVALWELVPNVSILDELIEYVITLNIEILLRF